MTELTVGDIYRAYLADPQKVIDALGNDLDLELDIFAVLGAVLTAAGRYAVRAARCRENGTHHPQSMGFGDYHCGTCGWVGRKGL